ncbi:hypothetical protein [Chryseobacterium oncorhynchi]|uniref:Uncharacterized protein n=1 Tax=Chryseobacterium oncorhynchi TaxID=741074 RepID=A0A316WH12_9FLAO|nr:hypothetical protein [Chryseobacterium oncorhynchi]PWN60731.1 hypothetical protein C1638_019890 [Chryseobacterium oncorhynchi]
MKNKLRKIVVDHKEYLYLVTDKYHHGTETNTLTVKIFVSGNKQSPLIIDFLTFDDYIMGQPLKSGISLVNNITDSIEIVNMNEPKYIRQLIVQGLKNGWIGENMMERQNGLNYLKELGFEIEKLQP